MKYFCLFIFLSNGYISYSQNENVDKNIYYNIVNSPNSYIALPAGGRGLDYKTMSEFQFDSLIKIANNKNMHVGLSTPRLVVFPRLILGNDTLTFLGIPETWFPKFNELLYSEDKDWLANIFMYKIAKRPGFNLMSYRENNDYERWKKEWKKEEIKEWEEWISNSKNGGNQKLSPRELYEKKYDKLRE